MSPRSEPSIERSVGGVVRRLLRGGVAVVALAAAPLAYAPPAAAQRGTTEVTVVHGLRGQLVDVYLDGEKLLDAFEPDRLTEPLEVPAGRHTIDLRPAGSPATDPPRATASPDLPAGSVAVVAHFDATGGWTMSVFRDDVTEVAPGSGRLVVRNASAVSPVDVEVRGGPAVAPIPTGSEAVQTVAAASYPLAVTSPSGSTLIPDSDVAVEPGAGRVVYLVGQNSNLTWLTQTIPIGSSAPTRVSAGDSGLAEATVGSAWPGAALLAMGSALVLSAFVVRRRPSV